MRKMFVLPGGSDSRREHWWRGGGTNVQSRLTRFHWRSKHIWRAKIFSRNSHLSPKLSVHLEVKSQMESCRFPMETTLNGLKFRFELFSPWQSPVTFSFALCSGQFLRSSNKCPLSTRVWFSCCCMWCIEFCLFWWLPLVFGRVWHRGSTRPWRTARRLPSLSQ